MATVLIVDDRAVNREFVATLLGYRQHRVIEAADGAEALARMRVERPDLVISDILMPTMDGYEFVQQVRADAVLAHTPVIFLSAHYLEREARALAQSCGVREILTKPIEPETLLHAVDTCLRTTAPVAVPTRPRDAFDREHLHLLTDKLSVTHAALSDANLRLQAMLEFFQELATSRNPAEILTHLCRGARAIVGARYAIAASYEGSHHDPLHVSISGLEADVVAGLGPPNAGGLLGELLAERSGIRCPPAAAAALGLPEGFPTVACATAVPISSPNARLGWLCLIDKLGLNEFSAHDEQVAATLAAQAGRIYENGRLYVNLRERKQQLEAEMQERRGAEVEVRAREEHFRALIENASDLIAVLNRSMMIVYASPSHERVFGYRADEMVGRSALDLVHSADSDAWAHLLATSIDSPTASAPREFRFRHRDGGWRVLEGTVKNLLADPAVRGLVVNAWDVTERRRAERSATTLLEVANGLSGRLVPEEVLQIHDRIAADLPCDGVVVYLWDAAERVFNAIAFHGVPPTAQAPLRTLADLWGTATLSGESPQAMMVNDIGPSTAPFGISAEQLGARSMMLAPVHTADGVRAALLVWRGAAGDAFTADDGVVLSAICKQVAVALVAAELYRASRDEGHVAAALVRIGAGLIASVDSGLAQRVCELAAGALRCDVSYTLLWSAADKAYTVAAAHGVSAEQWEELRVLHAARKELEGVMTGFRRAEVVRASSVSGTLAAVHVRFGFREILLIPITRGGDTIGAQVAARTDSEPFSPVQQRIARGIGHLSSLALETARLFAELTKANRLKSEFLATMSHELRTPLNIIMGYTDLFRETAYGPITREQATTLDAMDRSARELLALIENLLDLGRLEVGEAPLRLSTVSPAALLDELRTETRELQSKPNIEFVWAINPDLPALSTDAVKFKVVLKNLLSNAVKYTDAGRITVGARRFRRGLEFSVADTGIGIAPEVQPIIFDAFRQGEPAMTRSHGGVGLGLYVVRRLVEMLDAQVHFETTVGKGSCFRVRIRSITGPQPLRSPL